MQKPISTSDVFFKISISFWLLCTGFYISTGTSEWIEAGIYYVWRAFTQYRYLIFDQDGFYRRLHWNSSVIIVCSYCGSLIVII